MDGTQTTQCYISLKTETLTELIGIAVSISTNDITIYIVSCFYVFIKHIPGKNYIPVSYVTTYILYIYFMFRKALC